MIKPPHDLPFATRISSHWISNPDLPEMVFLDLETTGLSPIVHEIIEIGAIKISKTGEISYLQTLVKPRGQVSESNQQIHGITPQMLKDAPSLEEVLPKCLAFFGPHPLVGHNVQFDCGFLLAAATATKQRFQDNVVFDTCKFSRQVAKNLSRHPQNHKLTTLASLFNINHQHHRALDDSKICLEVFINLMNMTSIEDLQKLFWKKSMVCVMPNIIDSFGMCDKILGFLSNSEHSLLRQTISVSGKLKMAYLGGTQGDKPRPIRPIAILPMPNGPILHAECLLSHQIKNFKFKKIKTLCAYDDC